MTAGPLDTERLSELEAVDAKIEAAAGQITLEIVEESPRSALLARGLDKPRTEVDGRFDRAERLAREVSNSSQLHRIWYQRAWTAVWWFDDMRDALRLYDLLAAEVLNSEVIWEIEDLVNLWLALQFSHRQEVGRTAALRAALQRHADDHSKKTSSLWGRTLLLLMDLTKGAKDNQSLDPTLHALRMTLGEVRRHIEFSAEPIVRIVRELSSVLGDSPAYDQLLDSVIELEQERHGERARVSAGSVDINIAAPLPSSSKSKS